MVEQASLSGEDITQAYRLGRRPTNGQVTVPAMDEQHAQQCSWSCAAFCRIWISAPAVCVPSRQRAHIWPLSQAACDGVILGNQEAIEQTLPQQCSEVKSLIEWFACIKRESSSHPPAH